MEHERSVGITLLDGTLLELVQYQSWNQVFLLRVIYLEKWLSFEQSRKSNEINQETRLVDQYEISKRRQRIGFPNNEE